MTEYLLTRVHKILRYPEHFGPLVSCPREIEAQAHKLLAKEGFTVRCKPWARATRTEKAEARERPRPEPVCLRGFVRFRKGSIYTMNRIPADPLGPKYLEPGWALYKDGHRVKSCYRKDRTLQEIDWGYFDDVPPPKSWEELTRGIDLSFLRESPR